MLRLFTLEPSYAGSISNPIYIILLAGGAWSAERFEGTMLLPDVLPGAGRDAGSACAVQRRRQLPAVLRHEPPVPRHFLQPVPAVAGAGGVGAAAGHHGRAGAHALRGEFDGGVRSQASARNFKRLSGRGRC